MAKVYLVKKCYSKRKCHNKLDDTSSSAHRHCFDFFQLLVFVWTFQLLGHRSHFDQWSSTLPQICCLYHHLTITISASLSPCSNYLTLSGFKFLLGMVWELSSEKNMTIKHLGSLWGEDTSRTLVRELSVYFFSNANSFPHRLQFHVLRSGESVRCDNTGAGGR